MKIEPVQTNKSPGYPNQYEFIEHPDMLLSIPAAWRQKKLVATALAMFFLFGCKNADTKGDDLNKGDNYLQTTLNKIRKHFARQTQWAAPVFIHGSGDGATGCMVMGGASFISEKDAKSIIETELAKEGILFDGKSKLNKKYASFSTDYNLLFEYITFDNYFNLGGKWDNNSSVTEYDFTKIAEQRKKHIFNESEMNVVVFYDPAYSPPFEERGACSNKYFKKKYKEYSSDEFHKVMKKIELCEKKVDIENNKKAEYLLKLQVIDFINWLKHEGILESIKQQK